MPTMDRIATQMKQEAEFYAALGLSCFDLPWGRKVPDRPWREFQRNRAPPEQLREMFATRRNIAIATGAAVSDIIFVDLDSQEALHEANKSGWIGLTPIVSETRRGLQLGFRPPSVPVRNAVKLDGLFDIRSDGGYVVAPSSLHPSGFRYRRLGDWLSDNIPTLPEELIPKEVKREEPIQKPLIETPDLGRVYKYLDKCDMSVSGNGGHRTFFGVCCRLLRAFPWLSWDQFVSAATYYSDHRSDPSWKPSEIFHKCQDSWRKERMP